MRHATANFGYHSVEAADLGEESVAFLAGVCVEAGGGLRLGGSCSGLRIEGRLLDRAETELPILVVTPNIHLIELDRAHKLFAQLLASPSSMLLARPTRRFIQMTLFLAIPVMLSVLTLQTPRPLSFVSFAPLSRPVSASLAHGRSAGVLFPCRHSLHVTFNRRPRSDRLLNCLHIEMLACCSSNRFEWVVCEGCRVRVGTNGRWTLRRWKRR